MTVRVNLSCPSREGSETIVDNTQILIKHSAAIHMTNVLSPWERRAYNSLLYLARPTLARGVDHVVDTRRLMSMVGTTASHRDDLIDAVMGLVGRTVTYNVFGKDSQNDEHWRITSTLLADAGVTADRSKLRYSFPNSIVDLLRHPSLYARINLSVQRKMRRASAMALYEFYLDMLGARRNEIEFSIDVSSLRLLLGATDKLKEFKVLRRYAIDPSHEEINAVSDLRVSVASMARQGKSIARLVMRVERARERLNDVDPDGSLPIRDEPISEDAVTATPVPDAASSTRQSSASELFEAHLADLLGPDAARRALTDYGPARVRANFDYAHDKHRRGGIRSLRAYFIHALQNDYAESASRTATPAPPDRSHRAAKQAPQPDPKRATEDRRNQEIRAWYSGLSDDEQALWRASFEASERFSGIGSVLRKSGPSSPLYMGALLLFLAERGTDVAGQASSDRPVSAPLPGSTGSASR